MWSKAIEFEFSEAFWKKYSERNFTKNTNPTLQPHCPIRNASACLEASQQFEHYPHKHKLLLPNLSYRFPGQQSSPAFKSNTT
jgi:hypothetical protein